MNPTFWVLVILAAIMAWFILAPPIFKIVGRINISIFKRAKDKMKIENEESEENSK